MPSSGRPSVYLDECVHRDLVEALRKRGFAAVSATDEQMLQVDDESQLTYATVHGWAILTYNDRDFLRLHRACQERGRPHGGIIVLPQKTTLEVRELRAALMLDWIATLDDFRSRFFRWGQLQHLLERGYRPLAYTESEIQLALGRI